MEDELASVRIIAGKLSLDEIRQARDNFVIDRQAKLVAARAQHLKLSRQPRVNVSGASEVFADARIQLEKLRQAA